MGKANLLKDSMKGGLNSLLTSTAPSVKAEAQEPAAAPAAVPTTPKQRETAVHCNFVIDKSIHTRMKYLAIAKNMSLRDIVNQAMLEYLERNEE
jgi:predicted HicB family RNase H-like nuclease